MPASLPVEIYNGTVVTATNAKITNNAKFGSVKVKAVSVKDGSFKIGNYDVFTGSKTIALKLNGISTKRAGNLEISQSAFPVIAPQESLPRLSQGRWRREVTARDTSVEHQPSSRLRRTGRPWGDDRSSFREARD